MKTCNHGLTRSWHNVAILVAGICFVIGQMASGQVRGGPSGKPEPGTEPKSPPTPVARPAQPGSALSGDVVDLGNGVRIESVLVPAGSFEMGGNGRLSYSNEEPAHRVTISRPFLMGKYEVTQAQWKAVMGSNPSKFVGNDQLPVEMVSWNDSQEFIRKLNAMTGRQFRLPTEAEWEYACRAGTTGDFAGGLLEMGWYLMNSRHSTHPVGTKQPNPWGLHDMHGNVWEWCQDWLDDSYYKRSPATDPTGASTGKVRVFRGGCYAEGRENCRSAMRTGSSTNTRSACGIRLAVSP